MAMNNNNTKIDYAGELSYRLMWSVAKRIAKQERSGDVVGAQADYEQHIGELDTNAKAVFDKMIIHAAMMVGH